MTDFDSEIGKIDSREVNKKYGEVKKLTTQQLYRNYAAWMKERQPNVVPMSFKEWINWAKDKGVVKKFAADAVEEEKVTKVVKKTSKTVAVIMILLGVGAMALTFVNFKTGEQQQIKQ